MFTGVNINRGPKCKRFSLAAGSLTGTYFKKGVKCIVYFFLILFYFSRTIGIYGWASLNRSLLSYRLRTPIHLFFRKNTFAKTSSIRYFCSIICSPQIFENFQISCVSGDLNRAKVWTINSAQLPPWR